MADTVTMSWKDWRGNTVTHEVNQVIDIRDYVGTPGWALLVIAANTSMSVTNLLEFMDREGVSRGRKWTNNRRWLFQQPGTSNAKGPRSNLDGKAIRAIKIMRENPELSLRDLTRLLKESGIARSREWVRKHRCDSLS